MRRSVTLELFDARIRMSRLKDIDGLFNRRHLDREVIVLCIRWHLRYRLSLRDLIEMRSHRGLSMTRTTIMRWIKRFTPEFIKRSNRFGTPAGA
jgi:transposase-like protein